MTQIKNDSVTHSGEVPPHLLPEDPFISKLSWEADVIAAFYLIVIGLVSIFGNGYVIYMTIKQKNKLKPAELMTVNLAIFDFGMAGVWFQRRHAFVCLGFIWLYAVFWATIPLVGWGEYVPEPFGTSCTLNWWLAQASVNGQVFILSILFFCLVIPTAIIVFSYVKIISKVKSSAKEVAHFDSRVQGNHLLEIKLTKVAMLICAGFLIAWIPYAVVSIWSAFGSPDSVPIKASLVPTLFAKSAAMYNPIIYQVIDCRCSYERICGCLRSSHPKTSDRNTWTISASRDVGYLEVIETKMEN